MRFAIPAGAVALLLSAAAVPTFAAATSIGFNFSNGGTTVLASDTSAGAPTFAQASWNNLNSFGGTTSPGTLVDNSAGGTGTLSVSWGAGFDSGPGTAGAGFTAGDATLYSAFIGQTGDTNLPSITVTNVPYSSYEVVAYVEGDGTYNRAGGIALANVAGQSGGLNTNAYYYETDYSGVYTQSTQTTPPSSPYSTANYQTANYVVFTGNSASSFVLQEIDNQGAYGVDVGFAGFQIIDTTPTGSPVPEPASLALLGVASLGLLRRRRAR